MPVHDWTRIDAGIYHDFHLSWIDEIKKTLNGGLLPSGYYALAEQITGRLGPDVLTLQRPLPPTAPNGPKAGGILLETAPPKVRFRQLTEWGRYSRKTRRIAIRHVSRHQIIAMIEMVSPGNKSDRRAIASFVRKAHDALYNGIHLLIVDLFPPNALNPHGLHPLICDGGGEFKFSKKQPLTCLAYIGDPDPEAFIEPFAVGDRLPSMPLFLTADEYISVPLEKTYRAAWNAVPEFWRHEIEK
jgi:hypothetical protein